IWRRLIISRLDKQRILGIGDRYARNLKFRQKEFVDGAFIGILIATHPKLACWDSDPFWFTVRQAPISASSLRQSLRSGGAPCDPIAKTKFAHHARGKGHRCIELLV